MNKENLLKNTFFVIMAGGIGSRFWPASRESLPKQFLDVLGTGRSLIRMTYDRIRSLVPDGQIIVMTHERYRDLIKEHLSELPDENILVEPSRQNTGPCVAYVSFHIAARNPAANLVILPADHFIAREEKFKMAVTSAVEYVSDYPDILTLGMAPHRPDTGYGYIQLGDKTGADNIYQVRAFKEKPNLELAQQYLNNGDYVWNAGIFISSVTTMLKAYESHAPQIFSILNAPGIYGGDGEIPFIREHYAATPSISIDYAIMEKANNIVCYVVDMGWSDIGTWKSLYELRHQDEGDIVINLSSDNYRITDSQSLMIHGRPGKKIVIRGLENMMVVDLDDILMIWPLNEEQEVKKIRDETGTQWKLE